MNVELKWKKEQKAKAKSEAKMEMQTNEKKGKYFKENENNFSDYKCQILLQ